MRVPGSRRSAVALAAALLLASLAPGCGDDDPAPSPPPATPEDEGGPPPEEGAPPADGGTGDVCAGLAPSFGDAVEQRFDTGTHRDCSVATSSTSGQVALGIEGSVGGGSGTIFSLHSADGSKVGTTDGTLQNMRRGDDVDSWFHPTGGGYQGIVHPGSGASPTPLRTFGAGGELVRDTEGAAVSSAPDRNGGSLLLERTFDPSSATTPLGPTQLEWVDASGQVARAVPLDRHPLFVISSWSTGHAVVVVPGAPGSARWFDESGSALTPWFDVGEVAARAVSLYLLVDGTIAVSSEGRWVALLTDGAASAGTVPQWLASRPSTRLATIRQGRAYAVLPTSESSSANARFEIVAASGKSCGTFSIPPASARSGEEKRPRRLDVGYDGTLLQASSLALTPNEFGIHCTFRWWSKLLE